MNPASWFLCPVLSLPIWDRANLCNQVGIVEMMKCAFQGLLIKLWLLYCSLRSFALGEACCYVMRTLNNPMKRTVWHRRCLLPTINTNLLGLWVSQTGSNSPALVMLLDNCSPSQHLHRHLMRDPESEPSSSVALEHCTTEIVWNNKCVLLFWLSCSKCITNITTKPKTLPVFSSSDVYTTIQFQQIMQE